VKATLKALMGDKADKVPKDVPHQANEILAQTKNPATGTFWERSDPGWPKAFSDVVTKLTLERRPPRSSNDDAVERRDVRRGLIAVRNQHTQDIRSLRAAVARAGLMAEPAAIAKLEQDLAAAIAKRDAVDRQRAALGKPAAGEVEEPIEPDAAPATPTSPAKPSAALALPPDRKQAIKTATVQVLKKKYPDRAAAIDADSRAFWLSLSDADRAALSPEVDRLIQGAR